MPRLSRMVVPGYPHHVTQRGVRSLPIFRNDDDRKSYLNLLSEFSQRAQLEILAWCLMTNHVHLVVLPRRENALARGLGEAHRRYTRNINFAEGVRGHLFQERFHSCALDERHLIAAARYTELNPVKAGLCALAEDWEWSSARFHLGLIGRDPLVRDITLMGSIAAGQWGGLLKEQTLVDEQLEKAVKIGRPAGDGAFLSKLEEMTGRVLQARRPGRPRKVRAKQ